MNHMNLASHDFQHGVEQCGIVQEFHPMSRFFKNPMQFTRAGRIQVFNCLPNVFHQFNGEGIFHHDEPLFFKDFPKGGRVIYLWFLVAHGTSVWTTEGD